MPTHIKPQVSEREYIERHGLEILSTQGVAAAADYARVIGPTYGTLLQQERVARAKTIPARPRNGARQPTDRQPRQGRPKKEG